MDVDEQHVAVLIDELDGLVLLPVLVDTDQPVEPPDAVVDVDDVVARPQLVELGDGHLLVALDFAVDTVTLVITVENLVVGIKAQPELAVDEPSWSVTPNARTTACPRPIWWKILTSRSTCTLFSERM